MTLIQSLFTIKKQHSTEQLAPIETLLKIYIYSTPITIVYYKKVVVQNYQTIVTLSNIDPSRKMSKSWYWNRYVRVCTTKKSTVIDGFFCTTMKFRKTFFIYPLYEKCLKNGNALTKILLLPCKLVENVCVRKLRILYLCDVYMVFEYTLYSVFVVTSKTRTYIECIIMESFTEIVKQESRKCLQLFTNPQSGRRRRRQTDECIFNKLRPPFTCVFIASTKSWIS